jgi:serine/threonine-protein phosphatase 2A regulatory subunit A
MDIDLMDDEEEVLLALAEILGQFLDYVGGPAHAMHVIKILEKLCQVEETTVRDKVISNRSNSCITIGN